MKDFNNQDNCAFTTVEDRPDMSSTELVNLQWKRKALKERVVILMTVEQRIPVK